MGKPSRSNRNPRTYTEVLAAIKDRGYVVNQSGKHPSVMRGNGSVLFKFASTPSDSRGARAMWMTFKRAVRADEQR